MLTVKDGNVYHVHDTLRSAMRHRALVLYMTLLSLVWPRYRKARLKRKIVNELLKRCTLM